MIREGFTLWQAHSGRNVAHYCKVVLFKQADYFFLKDATSPCLNRLYAPQPFRHSLGTVAFLETIQSMCRHSCEYYDGNRCAIFSGENLSSE